MVEAVLGLLKDLLQQDERYLITNQSMHTLITLYEPLLLGAIQSGTGRSLIAGWKQEIPLFRQPWLNSPFVERSAFRGKAVTVVTESATSDAQSGCAQRKYGGGGSPAGGGGSGSRRP
jgi:hypothetical protein